MKYFFLLLILLSTGAGVTGQTFSEWFRQRKTQQKYMLQQIAGLQVYIHFAKNGYNLVRDGLNGISRIRNGEFNLHQDFFRSLAELNPGLQKDVKGLVIPGLSLIIHTSCRKEKALIEDSEHFDSEEKQYLQAVLKKVEADTEALGENYEKLTGTGQLALSDDERLSRLSVIREELLENLAFIKNLGGTIRGIVHDRSQEKKQLSHSLRLYGIKE